MAKGIKRQERSEGGFMRAGMRLFAFSVIASLCVVVSSSVLSAQSTDGTILGTVKDASEAAIADAQVTVTNAETGIAKTAVTNKFGDYEVPGLLPGKYDVEVSSKGFQTSVQRGFFLETRAIVRADATLQVGATQTKVEVNSASPVITTENATISEGFETEEIKDLPLNYRATYSAGAIFLVSLLPTVQTDNGYNLTLAGGHTSMNEVTMDGFSIMSNRFNNGITQLLPSTESISEINVTSELGDAEIGQVGQISFIGHGGTNQYHGSLFEYFQNDALDAVPLFQTEKAKLRANDFGGALGGPIRFPGYNGKDRTFFFFDTEFNRNNTSNSIVEGVPTPDMRNGNFSALCSTYSASGVCNSPTGITLVNPFTGLPYPMNTIPTGQINTVSQNILNTFYPQPNFNSGDISSNYRVIAPAPAHSNQFDVRLDEKITDKQLLWGRYDYRRSNDLFGLGLLQGSENQIDNTDSFGLTYDYNIKSNLLNEARFGYVQQYYGVAFPQFPNGAALIAQLGLNLPGPFQSGSAIPGFIFQQSSIASTANNRQENRHEHRYQFDDNLNWIHGRHALKFGTDIRWNGYSDFVQFTGADNFGNFDFDGAFTGFDFADFLLGLPSQSNITNAGPNFSAKERAYAFYAQDEFTVSPKLTINFGLRYEVHPPFFDPGLNMANFDTATGAVILPNQAAFAITAPIFLASINACPGNPGATTPCTPVLPASQVGLPKALRKTDYTKILPRFSFAYRLTDRWVIRGGFGMYDMTLLGNVFYNGVGINTADVLSFSNSFTAGTPAIQFPNTAIQGIGNVPPIGSSSFFTATQFNLHDPYAMQWNLTGERELARNTGLRVTYTGMKTIGLLVNEDANTVPICACPYNPALKPFPNWLEVYQGVNGGESFYNAVGVVLTQRFDHGLVAQSSYYYTHNLSDADGSAGSLNGNSVLENGPFITNRFDLKSDWGNVNFTHRHRWLNTYVYKIPYGHGEKFGSDLNPILNAIAGNWQMSGTFLVQSGPFLTPNYYGGTDPSGTGANFKSPGQRPDRVCSGTVPNPGASGYFNVSCFPIPESNIGRFGNSGVGILTGPGTVVWNAGVFKVFPVKERLRFRVEATFTNILNHANLGVPDMNAANLSDFGVVHSGQSQEGSGSRTGQLGLRMDF
jgi:hypothetical protein